MQIIQVSQKIIHILIFYLWINYSNFLHNNKNYRICLWSFIPIFPYIATWQDNLSCNYLVSYILARCHFLYNLCLLALFYLAKQFVTWPLTIYAYRPMDHTSISVLNTNIYKRSIFNNLIQYSTYTEIHIKCFFL